MMLMSWPTLMNKPCSSQIVRSMRRALRKCAARSFAVTHASECQRARNRSHR